ncbi:hypothetical protein LTR72_009465 [Exophiala xenobiotica]|nr:hypothetical protein LTR72_009465 [Exophiala xenobiotica]KAK5291920.1 hypothetical protein LTR14_005469 [Exophiala xenobiotica]KAK5494667.1 hypothetical protein LTR55_003054 [Exophiala xenobiotica]
MQVASLNPRILTSAAGTKIPALGLGTFEPGPPGSGRCSTAVKEGILAGYRHIDTAALYGCEEEVGEGIRSSGIERKELVVCTKFWQQWHQPEDVVKSLNDSLSRMKLDYVDLYLMHWPLAFKRTEDYQELMGEDGKPIVDHDLTENHEPTWRAMEQLVDTGKARAIGVSNFTIPQLERLLSFARIKPVCNQVEAHPWFPQKEMLDFCRRNGIIFVAYSPLGTQPRGMHTIKARLMDDEDVVAVAKRNGVDAAQVLIAWALQRGTVAIPKSSTPSRIVSNFNVPELSHEDFKCIDEIVDRDPSKRNRFVNFDAIWGTSQFDHDA